MASLVPTVPLFLTCREASLKSKRHQDRRRGDPPLFFSFEDSMINFRLMQQECAGGTVPKYHLPKDIRDYLFLEILEILKLIGLTFSKDLVYTLTIENKRSHISWKVS